VAEQDRMRYIITFLIALFGFSSVLFAFEQPLKDVYQEQRAKDIFRSLKCEVCKGQTILDSESEFAASARELIRQKILEGKNDEQIYDILKTNYGQQIMFKPPFDEETILLWLMPFILIFAGFMIVVFVLRKNKMDEPA
jgi:cytochrome c-type biogenesis protein CcmH